MKTLLLVVLVVLLAGCGDPNYAEQADPPQKTVVFPVADVYSSSH